jgi:DNA-binding LacI/PurR family transcriptional regulator
LGILDFVMPSIKVPENLSAAGYDDTPLSRRTWPKLTTLHQPIRDMARRSNSWPRTSRGREPWATK